MLYSHLQKQPPKIFKPGGAPVMDPPLVATFACEGLVLSVVPRNNLFFAISFGGSPHEVSLQLSMVVMTTCIAFLIRNPNVQQAL